MALCFLCGQDGADSSDHVVPRGFYAEPYPPNLFTAPAHATCNNYTSKDEEYVRDSLVWCSITGRESQEDTYRKAAVARNWEANPKYRDAVAKALQHLPGDWGAFSIDVERILWVLAKVCRGLWIEKYGVPMPTGGMWFIREADQHTFLKVEAAETFSVEPMTVKWSRLEDRLAAFFCIFEDHFFCVGNSVEGSGTAIEWTPRRRPQPSKQLGLWR